MFNDYEVYMLSKLKQKEMIDLNPFQLPLSKKDKRNINLELKTKSVEMTCCPSVCCLK